MKKITIILIILFSLLLFTKKASIVDASSSAEIHGPDLIQKGQYQVLTLSDILNLYSSEFGGVMIQADNFTGNGAKLGSYSIDLMASNGSEQSAKTVTIEVLAAIGYSVRAVTDKVNIHIAKTNKLNPSDIVQIHNKTGVYNLNQTSQLQILSDNYSSAFDTPGKYLYEYRIMDATGFDKTVSCYITVYESERIEGPIITIDKPAGLFENLKGILNTVVGAALVIVIAYFGFKLFRKGRSLK